MTRFQYPPRRRATATSALGLLLLVACSGGGSGGRPRNPTLTIVAPASTEFTGTMARPFAPATIDYTLTNPTTESVDWSVSCDTPWAEPVTPTGTLAAGANTVVSIRPALPIALALPEGRFTSRVSFTDVGTGREEASDEVSAQVALEPSLHDRTGPQRVAVILVDFLDATEPVTAQTLLTNVFTGPVSGNAWYQEVSYGATSFVGSLDPAGDVFLTSLPVVSTTCNYATWGELARAQAALDGFVASNYDFVFYVFAGACRSRGRPNWTPPSTWMNNAGLRAVCHEGGHAIGWAHASGYACTAGGANATISPTCTVDEYGDPFDMMGSADSYHPNGHKRAQFGWLPAANTHTIVEDGSYALAPIEVVTGQLQVLRIPRVVGPSGIEQFLYLEARQPSGTFETFLPTDPVATGVTLRLAGRYDMGGRSYLLDTHPQTSARNDAPLQPGETFVDPDTGTAVLVTSVGPTGATLDVTLGTPLQCTPAAPSGGFTPSAIMLAPGDTASVALTFRNEDVDCAIAVFQGLYTVPPGWEDPELTTFENTLVPGAEALYPDVEVTVPLGTAPGVYLVSLDVTNTTSGLVGSFDLTVTVP